MIDNMMIYDGKKSINGPGSYLTHGCIVGYSSP